jgi:hypothetical protein
MNAVANCPGARFDRSQIGSAWEQQFGCLPKA